MLSPEQKKEEIKRLWMLAQEESARRLNEINSRLNRKPQKRRIKVDDGNEYM
jgi:hypothetical protein